MAWYDLGTYPYVTPKLRFPVDALEPNVSVETMQLHHDVLHERYTHGTNAFVQARALVRVPIITMAQNPWRFGLLDEEVFQLGGYLNHALLWSTMAPHGRLPRDSFAKQLYMEFASAAGFLDAVLERIPHLLGSGWVWLVTKPPRWKLSLMVTPNQMSPLFYAESMGLTWPLWGLDLWEHAYLLDRGADKSTYTNVMLNITDWAHISRVYEGIVSGHNPWTGGAV